MAATAGRVGRTIWPHLPLVVLLSMGTVILHSLHVLDATEGYFMRWAVQVHLMGEAAADKLQRTADASLRVQVIEAGVAMRIKELEYGDDAPIQQLQRVGGVRPIDREKFARLLAALATRLADDAHKAHQGAGNPAHGPAPPQPLPRVVAIDVDIAPLPEDQTPAPQPQVAQRTTAANAAMAAALNALRQHAMVIAVVMDRDTPEQRQSRNLFLVNQAGCTRAAVPGGAGQPLAPAALRQAVADPPADHPLYLASSRVFHDLQRHHAGYPLSFAYAGVGSAASATELADPARQALQPTGSHFPSLSNLIHLSTPSVSRKDADRSALTLLCDQAARALVQRLPDALVLEDLASGHRPKSCAPSSTADEAHCQVFDPDQYLQRRINWRFQDSDLLGRTELESACQLPGTCSASTQPKLADEHLHAGALIIGVDGGARHDKYEVASVTADAISGATLHALQAVSARPGHDLRALSAWALGIDILAGAIFLLLWQPVQQQLQRARHVPRTLVNLLRVPLPVLLALALGWLAMQQISPAMLAFNVWVNPAYLLAGMAMHAYIEGWASALQQGGHAQHAADFSFGLGPLLGQVAAIAPSRHGGLRPAGVLPRWAAFSDAAMNWLAQWVVLACAGVQVFIHYDGGVAFVVALLVIIAWACRRSVTKGPDHEHQPKH